MQIREKIKISLYLKFQNTSIQTKYNIIKISEYNEYNILDNYEQA